MDWLNDGQPKPSKAAKPLFQRQTIQKHKIDNLIYVLNNNTVKSTLLIGLKVCMPGVLN